MRSPTIKAEEELAWSRYLRRLRAIATVEAADWRDKRVNDLVSEHWPKFQEALERGEILALPDATEEQPGS